MEELINWARFTLDDWQVTLAATEKGLCYVGVGDDNVQHMKDWLRRSGAVEMQEDATSLEIYISEIRTYFSGIATEFKSLPLDVSGTSFQHQVWEVLRGIPYGETVTYSDIAEQLGKPSSVRAVASAIGKNPVLLIVPCHRVIAKNGDLSGYRDGKERKAQLIMLERKAGKVTE